ncbi:MAG: winged helix DNA-binding protein [Candidatus Berkelbacteria bacterium]|nr:winged helix DNA-binding protein [Candidatus Berkelbacteria bacterium]
MRKDDQKEIVKLTSQKVLLTLLKLGFPFFKANGVYHQSASKLSFDIDYEQQELSDRIRYLKEMGYIKTYTEGKEKYLELTEKGINRSNSYLADEKISINRPEKWDGEWWIVVYDIPKDKSSRRDQFRRMLRRLQLISIQESIFVFPFDCTQVIDQILYEIGISDYVSIFAARAIRNEELIIKRFIDNKVLTKSDLSK